MVNNNNKKMEQTQRKRDLVRDRAKFESTFITCGGSRKFSVAHSCQVHWGLGAEPFDYRGGGGEGGW